MVTTRCPAVGVPTVAPCEPAELAPLVAWLGERRGAAAPLAFPRGTVLPDGRLDLCKQGLGPGGARLVLDALRGHPAIRAILFGTGGIGNAGAAAVADALDAGLTLDTVYLGCNAIDGDGVRSLARAGARRGVDALWLKRNPLGVAGAHAIAEVIGDSGGPRVLDLFNCELDDDGVIAIARAVAAPACRVAYLYLGGNGAGPRAAAALATAIASNRALRGLYLGASRLGDAGAGAIADALERNPGLEELDLASNAIGPAGAAALARAVAVHPRLARLDLGAAASARALGEPANAIGDAGALALAAALAGDPPLRALDLRANGITSHGAMALARALAANTHLIDLGLHHFVARTIRRALRARLDANAAHAAPPTMPAHVAAIQSVYRTRPPAR